MEENKSKIDYEKLKKMLQEKDYNKIIMDAYKEAKKEIEDENSKEER